MEKRQVHSLGILTLASIGFLLISTCTEARRHKATTSVLAPTSTQSTDTPTGRIQLDGLEYEVITQAPAGAKTPQTGHTVFVHYTGWLNENGQKGKQFDSSLTRNDQFSFVLGAKQVISGWDKIVAKMKVGEKVLVYIPSYEAYGSKGIGNLIPKNANLIFEIELLSIKEVGTPTTK